MKMIKLLWVIATSFEYLPPASLYIETLYILFDPIFTMCYRYFIDDRELNPGVCLKSFQKLTTRK